LRLFGKDPTKFGKNGDIDIASLAKVSFPIHARISIRSVVEKKNAAGACHASQGGGQMQTGIRAMLSRFFEADVFMQAYPPIEGKTRIQRDLLN
jgi:N-acetyl-1-D-myo-inositol-2-amino-2-deoxy-alpha-D-glucopyranoside deacetylase